MKKIIVLGSNGFLGNNIKNLINRDENKIFLCERKDVDVLNINNLEQYFKEINPDIVINCCGIVGSSEMNKNMDELDILNKNFIININVLNCCKKYNIKKLILFSTYRIFSDNIIENYTEENIDLNDNIQNNKGYLLSKKILHSQIKLFNENNKNTKIICLVLPNIFGKYDKFVLNGRIVPAFIKKIYDAKQKNEDLYINYNKNLLIDLICADDIFRIINTCITSDDNDLIKDNIIIFNKLGILTIHELSEKIKKIMNYTKSIIFSSDDNNNYNNIMKPNIGKFNECFTNFEFKDIDTELKETIEYFYIVETGIS